MRAKILEVAELSQSHCKDVAFWTSPIYGLTPNTPSHRREDRTRAGCKMLFDCPGYLYQGLVTNRPRTQPPLAVWREYNGRAACETIMG